MDTLNYCAPTALYCGINCISDNAEVIRSYGSRAFVLSSRFSDNCPNLALEEIEHLLSANGCEFEVYLDAEENPTVESIVRVTQRIRDFAPDHIIAIGGGSALDTAKAANVLLSAPESSDAYKVFYGGCECVNTCSSGFLPMLAIPTTAGSGSDVMGFAILTRSDTHTKLRINQLSFFDASFLDARYVGHSPQWLLDAGAVDALAHGIEAILNVKCTPLSSLWNYYGFRLFSEFKDNLLACSLSDDDCGKMLLAASVQGMGNLQCGSTIPHGMGYALTCHKAVPHGFASIIPMAAFLRQIKTRRDTVSDILQKCGFADINEFDRYIRAIVSRNVDVSVTRGELRIWAAECAKLTPRLEAHIEPISEEEIYCIYESSLLR